MGLQEGKGVLGGGGGGPGVTGAGGRGTCVQQRRLLTRQTRAGSPVITAPAAAPTVPSLGPSAPSAAVRPSPSPPPSAAADGGCGAGGGEQTLALLSSALRATGNFLSLFLLPFLPFFFFFLKQP